MEKAIYPHNYPEHWVAQNYLPEKLAEKRFYKPSQEGYEAKIFIKKNKETK